MGYLAAIAVLVKCNTMVLVVKPIKIADAGPHVDRVIAKFCLFLVWVGELRSPFPQPVSGIAFFEKVLPLIQAVERLLLVGRAIGIGHGWPHSRNP